MVRLMAALGTGIKLMLRPKWVDVVELQMTCGLGPVGEKQVVTHAIKQLREGVSIEWKGEQRVLKTGKADLLLVEGEQWSKNSGASPHRKEREKSTQTQEADHQATAQALQGAGLQWQDGQAAGGLGGCRGCGVYWLLTRQESRASQEGCGGICGVRDTCAGGCSTG